MQLTKYFLVLNLLFLSQIFSMEYKDSNDFSQPVDMLEVFPAELWVKVADFLPGNDRALTNFFATRFGINKNQAKHISRIVCNNVFARSDGLEDFFDRLNDLPIFLTANSEETRLKVFEQIRYLTKHIKLNMRLFKTVADTQKDRKIKKYLSKDFKRFKAFFKSNFGTCDINELSDLNINKMSNKVINSTIIKDVLLKIKRKNMFYKYCESCEINNKSDYLFISRLASMLLVAVVFCAINYAIYSDLPDVSILFAFYGLFNSILFAITAGISIVTKKLDLRDYSKMFDYIEELELFFKSINHENHFSS